MKIKFKFDDGWGAGFDKLIHNWKSKRFSIYRTGANRKNYKYRLFKDYSFVKQFKSFKSAAKFAENC